MDTTICGLNKVTVYPYEEANYGATVTITNNKTGQTYVKTMPSDGASLVYLIPSVPNAGLKTDYGIKCVTTSGTETAYNNFKLGFGDDIEIRLTKTIVQHGDYVAATDGLAITDGNTIKHSGQYYESSAGPSESKTVGFGNDFGVPYIKRDAYGHAKELSTKYIRMPDGFNASLFTNKDFNISAKLGGGYADGSIDVSYDGYYPLGVRHISEGGRYALSYNFNADVLYWRIRAFETDTTSASATICVEYYKVAST